MEAETAECAGCVEAGRQARASGRLTVCGCGAEYVPWRALAPVFPRPVVAEVPPAPEPLEQHPPAPPWTPNPLTDLSLVARWSSALFGRSLEPCPSVVGLGGNGASPGALGGRGDAVDRSRSYSVAVSASRVLRLLVRAGVGEDAAILWMAHGVVAPVHEQSAAHQAARAVALGFAPEPTRATWPRPARARRAVAWGQEQVAAWWEGIGPVPREIGLCVALGFAPEEARQPTRSRALAQVDDAAGWGRARLASAERLYLTAAEHVARGRRFVLAQQASPGHSTLLA